MPLGEIKNCDPNVMPAAPGRRSAEASRVRNGDSADPQLFEDENNVEPDASFAGHMSVESTPKLVGPARDVPPEPGYFRLLARKAGEHVSRDAARLSADGRSLRDG